MAKKTTKKSKPVAKAKKQVTTNMQKYRDYAQYFTITAAITVGLVSMFGTLMKTDTVFLDNLSSVLILATAVGGMLMGLLYALDSIEK